MKKLWATIKDKAITAAVWFMLSSGLLFVYNFGVDIVNIPKNIKELKTLHQKDSLIAVKYIEDIERLKKEVVRMYWRGKQDSTMFNKINTKLKIQ